MPSFSLRKLLGLGLILIILALPWLLDRLFPLPLPDPERDGATVVLARDGTPLRAFADHEGVWRYPISVQEVSPLYLQALLSYEDRWFYHHHGINPLAMLRASAQALWHRRVISGGSTLTMQVARLIEPIPHTGLGKLRQMARALQLEWHLDKEEILTLYLNYAPFGGTLQGVQAASYGYLGKPASELSHAEAALLAVLPQAPSRLRPDRWPERARKARDKVLERLALQHVWDTDILTQAHAENVAARSLHVPMRAALAAEYLHQTYPKQRRIQSTLDADLQTLLESRIADWVNRLPPRTSAAVIVAETRSMEVRAWIGAARFGDEESFGHIDMARAWRSPGSTLKPFLYGLALDAGLIHSASLLVDAPQEFDGYRPGNFDRRFRGPVTARDALQQSLNIPSVALLHHYGPSRFAARMAHAGIPLRLPHGTAPNLAMILGGTEARLEDLMAAYGALQRAGLAAAPRLLAEHAPSERRLLSPGAAWIVRQMLAQNARQDILEERLSPSNRSLLSWKTGTSYGFRDAWAIGATPGVVIGVWIGRPDGTPLPGQYGAITALPLLYAINDLLPRSMQKPAQPKPESVSTDTICWPLGQRRQDTRAEHCIRRHEAWILDATVPVTLPDMKHPAPSPITFRQDVHSGRRLSDHCSQPHEVRLGSLAPWPILAHPWLSGEERRKATLPALADDCRSSEAPIAQLHINGLNPDSILRSPPNSTRAPEVSVRALGADGPVQWLLNGQLVAESQGESPVLIRFEQTGALRLLVIDQRGRYAQLDVQVLP